jgi:hypothetical protein
MRMRLKWRRLIVVVLCQLLALLPAMGQQAGVQNGLKIVIVSGAGAKNVVQQITPRPIVIRIDDASGHPAAGAAVTFTAPEPGPSGEFAMASPTITLTTGPDGLASAGSFHPNGVLGPYQIQVRADFRGQTATAGVPQINVAQPKGHKKLIAIILLTAAAAGAAIAARYSKSTTTSTTPTITFGGGAVGAPTP